MAALGATFTPTEDFYVRSNFLVLTINIREWRLCVTGV